MSHRKSEEEAKNLKENVVYTSNQTASQQQQQSRDANYSPIFPKIAAMPVTSSASLRNTIHRSHNTNHESHSTIHRSENIIHESHTTDFRSPSLGYAKSGGEKNDFEDAEIQNNYTETTSLNNPEKETQKLACNYCRARRTKCDRKEPCGRCEAKNIPCETSSLDLRKKRVRAVDIDKLQHRIRELEGLLALKMGQSIVVETREHDSRAERLENSLTSFYNPSKDEKIIKSIKNFFTFLYPGLTMFIHRESFLHSFFNEYSSNYKESKYCSIELVYAVAAIGSQLSEDLKQYSEKYFAMAKEGVLQNRVFPKNTSNTLSLITSVQTLLALSLYELGNGNFGQSFYLSGIAFRIGFDMSFQLEPTAWFNPRVYNSDQPNVGFERSGAITKEDIEIRSRIYWGCYLTDHFICLILGRNPTLFCYNSTIKDSIEMSETAQTEDFKFQSKHTLLVSIPLKQLIILSRIVEIFTKGFFIEPNISREKKLHYLAKFNAKLEIWKSSLPGFLKWDQFSLNDPSYSSDPTITYFWYHYYIVVLTFNKPYVEENVVVIKNTLDSLQIMLTNFVNHYDKFNLYQLFAVSIALNILAKLKNNHRMAGLMSYVDDKIVFFNTILRKMSKFYDFATKLVEMHAYEDMVGSESGSSEVNIVYSKFSQHDSPLQNTGSYLSPNNTLERVIYEFESKDQENGPPNALVSVGNVLDQAPKKKKQKRNNSITASSNHLDANNAILSMLLNNQYNTDVDELTSLLLKNNEKTVNESSKVEPLKFISFNQNDEPGDESGKNSFNHLPLFNSGSSAKKSGSYSDAQVKSLFPKAPKELLNNIKHTNDFSFNVEVDEIIKKMFMDDDPEFEKFMKPAHSL